MKRWSRNYECCRTCQTTAIRHQARGMCLTCYQLATYTLKPDGYIAKHPVRWGLSERRKLKEEVLKQEEDREPGRYPPKPVGRTVDIKAMLKILRRQHPTDDWRQHLSPETRSILEAKERDTKRT